MPEVHVLGFAGSLRQASYNRALLRVAAEAAPSEMDVEIFDLLPIPLYNCDVEDAGVPEPVQRFKDRIAAADALLIVTPEYNRSIPGVLKNAIDWATRPTRESPFFGKPAAIMGGGGPFGTVRAQTHLRQVLEGRDMAVMLKPEVYVIRVAEKFDQDERLTDEPTRKAIRAFMQAFLVWTRRFVTEAAARGR